MPKPISYKHLGFTGSKDRITDKQVSALTALLKTLRDKGFLWMHNGDCITSDATAGRVWQKLKGKLYLHPPIKGTYRAHLTAEITCEPRDYLTRDRHIAESSHTMIATPQTSYEETRSGTWTTVRYARKLRRRIYIIFPDGTIKKE